MKEQQQETFFPTFLFKEMVVALILFFAVIALAWFFPAEMGDPADPSDSSFLPKPEWYFLPMYQFLKLFPGKLEVLGLFLQPLVLAIILFLPFLDKNPERRPAKRKTAMILLTLSVIATVILGILGYVT